MGLFSFSPLYSIQPHQLSEERIKKLVGVANIPYLKESEEALIQETIISRRRADGTISLQHIYEVLKELKNQHKISPILRDKTMSVFETYFDEQFPTA